MSSRTRRLRLLGGFAVAALVVVAVLIAISQGGGDDDGGGGGARAASDGTRLFRGIPQRGARLGDPDAPVRRLEFVDMQCPFCAQYARDVLPTLVDRYVREGELRIELRPLAFLGEDSLAGAKAAVAAAKQNRIWQFADVFFQDQGPENSGYVTPAFLRRVARAAGVSPGRVVAASRSSTPQSLLILASAEAQRGGIDCTPSFLIARRGQPWRHLEVSQLAPGEFTSRIDALLRQ